MSHSAGACGLATLALDGPGERAQLSSGVGALGTGLLLLVEGTVATTTAERVCLGVALSETGRSFSLRD